MRVYGNGDLATETTQTSIEDLLAEVRKLSDTMLYFTSAILDRLPTLDTAHRANVNVATGSVAVSGSLTTVTTVTTCGTVTNMTNLNNFAGGNTALIPYQLGAGSFHLYNGINVT